VGSGKDEKLLKDLATSLNIEKQVIFTGYKEDAYKYMRMMDLFIMPSLYEGFPIVHLEAMYMGVPCIIDAVLYLMENKEIRKNMVKEGNSIVQSFTMERYVEKLEKFYEDVGKRYYTNL
jgi:glycosyltransferase involved in cell wall biosynthesis